MEELGNVFVDFFCYFTVNYDKTKGVGVLVKKELSDLKILNVQYDLDSRFISIELQLDRIYFNFINIYAPNVENEQLEYKNKMYALSPLTNFASATIPAGHSIFWKWSSSIV